MPDKVFPALADRTRRSILRVLSTNGPCTATQMASDLPITRQAVSKHLGHLADAGLVVAQRQGRETHYRLVPDSLENAIEWLETLHGQARRKQIA